MRVPIKYPRKPVPDIKNPYGYIYIIRNNLNDKPYIGQKSSPVVVDSYWGSSEHLKEDIKTLGADNFTREVIDWASSKEELNEKEIFWIDLLGTFHGYGYNLSRGGDGLGSGKDHPCFGKHTLVGEKNPWYGIGLTFTPEIKKKMSDKAKMRTGKKNSFYGKHHTQEWKEKYRNGGNNPVAKSCFMYSESGEFIKKYDFVKSTEEDGHRAGTVSDRCRLKCKGKITTQRIPYHGYLWSYLPPVGGYIPDITLEPDYKPSTNNI